MAARRSMSPNTRPTTSAARRPAGSRPRRRFGLLAALLVILGTRTVIGEAGLRRLGLAHPVPVSVVLLGISVWMRVKLAESPAFEKLKDEGDVSTRPAARSLRQAGTISSSC